MDSPRLVLRRRCRGNAWPTSCGTPCRAATGWPCGANQNGEPVGSWKKTDFPGGLRWWFPKSWGYPPSHPFIDGIFRIFPYKPSSYWGYLHLWNLPYGSLMWVYGWCFGTFWTNDLWFSIGFRISSQLTDPHVFQSGSTCWNQSSRVIYFDRFLMDDCPMKSSSMVRNATNEELWFILIWGFHGVSIAMGVPPNGWLISYNKGKSH